MYSPSFAVLSAAGLILSATSPVRAESDVVKTDLMAVCLGGSVPGYFYQNGKGIAMVTAHGQGISSPVTYTGPAVIRFYKDKAEAESSKSGDSSPPPLATVTISGDSDRVLLLFEFSENVDVPVVRSYGIKNSTFGAGDYQIFNFSKTTVYGVLKDKDAPIVVPPGEQKIVKTSAWEKDAGPIQATFSLNSDSSVKPVYSSIWGHRPERRSFIVVSGDSSNDQRLKIAKFFDVPSVKAMKPQPPKESQ